MTTKESIIILITLEGIESCGKTTQAIVLECYLNMLGLDTIRTRMPGGCEISDQIRGILLDTENDNMATETEMLLFGAAYAQLMSEVIIPALQQDKVVICDRFFDSMFSYQLFGRRSPQEAYQNDIRVCVSRHLSRDNFFC